MALRSAPAAFIHPCQPIVAKQPPSGRGWAHELKHDGYRLQIHIRDGRVRLYTMNGADWSKRYPLIVRDAAKIKGSAIIDAEVVWLDAYGRSNFEALHSRANDGRASACAFDLLMRDGDDLRGNRIPSARHFCSRCYAAAARGSSTSSIRWVTEPRCSRRSASSAWRVSFQRSSMRFIARGPRESGSRSKIRKRLPRPGRLMVRSNEPEENRCYFAGLRRTCVCTGSKSEHVEGQQG